MKKILKLITISLLFFAVACSNEKTYGINEKIYVKNSLGEYGIEIIDVETKKSNKDEDIIIVTYELENRSINSPLSKDEWNFMAYNKKGDVLDNYLILSQNGKKASLGETIEMKIGYYYDGSDKYLKLKYFDDYKAADDNAIFELEW